jgi:threonine/homoserine/homoserine lactone efflux protein
MNLLVFVAGIIMGLMIAAPLGPANLLVVRATLTSGLAAGLAAGAGAVAADSFFAAVVAFGLHQVTEAFGRYATPISLLGGALLVMIGVHTALSRITPEQLIQAPMAANRLTLWRLAATNLSTTVTNPGAALGVLAVFSAAAQAIELEKGSGRPLTSIAGFILGGGLWWLALSFGIDRLRSRLSSPMLGRLNRGVGTLIAAFGFVLLLKAIGY